MTQLEISSFLSVVKYDSISTAAEKLFVTQPALSRRLNALERELPAFRAPKRQKSHTPHAAGKGIHSYRRTIPCPLE